MIGEFIDETLSGDRVVFSFITVWVIAGAIWIMLDWLGNTSRGRFVPKGDQHHGTRAERLEARRRQRAEDDAAVRSTLRDAYGTSSLRVTWTTAHETVAIDADNQLVRPDPRRPSASLREPVRLGTFSESGVEPLLGTFDPDMPFVVEATMPRGRWSVGANPLMLSRSGKPPTAATLSAATSATPQRRDTPQHRASFSGGASSHRSKLAVRGLSTASATAVAPFCPRAPFESSGWAETGCFSMPLLRS